MAKAVARSRAKDASPPRRVSVVIAAYNAAPFISRAIESVKAQSMADWEIVVSDDCSTDDTVKVVEGLRKADKRISLLKAPANGGPSLARNRGIAAARGEWIAILDADDAWRPERLERLLAAAEGAGADLVADNLVFYDDHLGAPVGVALPAGDEVAALTAEAVLASERPWPTFRLGFLKPIVRTGALARYGVRYDETIRYAEDFLFLAELLLRGCPAALSARPMYIYTMQHNSAAGRRSATTRSTYDPRQRLRIAEQLFQAHAATAAPADRAALAKFVTWMRDLCVGYDAVNGARAGRPASLLRCRPRALATYLVTTPSWKRALHVASLVRRPFARRNETTQRIM